MFIKWCPTVIYVLLFMKLLGILVLQKVVTEVVEETWLVNKILAITSENLTWSYDTCTGTFIFQLIRFHYNVWSDVTASYLLCLVCVTSGAFMLSFPLPPFILCSVWTQRIMGCAERSRWQQGSCCWRRCFLLSRVTWRTFQSEQEWLPHKGHTQPQSQFRSSEPKRILFIIVWILCA